MSVSLVDIVLSSALAGALTWGISAAVAHCFPSKGMLAREALDEKSTRSRFRRAISQRRFRDPRTK